MGLPGQITAEIADRQAEMLGNRVKKRLKKQRPRFERAGVEAFRLYDRDIPEVRVAVDWYAGHVVTAGYARTQTDALPDWLDRMAAGVAAALDVPDNHVHLKSRRTGPGGEDGSTRYEKLSETDRRMVVREGKLSFRVNLDDYIDTGLFLDHRTLRARVGKEAEGRDVLNLYGYTGSFTCYAAAGGARSTTTVDQSATYLRWLKDNLRLNGLDGPQHVARRDTVEPFLTHAARRRERWSLIVLDPPSRSTVGGADGRGLELVRDHRWLVEAALAVLAPGGTLYFSFNHQRLEPDLRGLDAEEITELTVPEDFRPHRPHRTFVFGEHR